MSRLRARRSALVVVAAATASILSFAPQAGAAPEPAPDPASTDTASTDATTQFAAAPVDSLATTDAATAGSCTVSAKLVPSCGAWLGASTAAKSGKLSGSDYVIGLNEYEAVAQNTPDILHFYKNGAQKFPTSTEIGMAERTGKQRSILYYNWKPGSGLTWRAVANGAADSAIQTVAASVKKYPHKLFMTVEHEPEADVGQTGKSAADYVAMFRYVVTKMKALGATNVVWVMNYMGYNSWTSLFDPLYPGDTYVDWIAYDPYGFKMHTDFGLLLNTPKSGWAGFYAWATKKAPGKPIMLGEWGWDLNKQPNAPTILDGATSIIQSKFPMLKALVYWNDDAGGFNVRIDQTTTLGKAYGAAYKRMANQSYYNQTSTAAAP